MSTNGDEHDHEHFGNEEEEEKETKELSYLQSSSSSQKEDHHNRNSPLWNPSTRRPSNRNNNHNNIVRNIWLAVTDAWAYMTIVLGIFLSLGLLLNLSGYAYRINTNWPQIVETHEIIHIDTIEQMRLEAQFQKELRQSASETAKQAAAAAAAAPVKTSHATKQSE